MVKDINTFNIINVHCCYRYMPEFVTCADVVQLLPVISGASNPHYLESKTSPVVVIHLLRFYRQSLVRLHISNKYSFSI